MLLYTSIVVVSRKTGATRSYTPAERYLASWFQSPKEKKLLCGTEQFLFFWRIGGGDHRGKMEYREEGGEGREGVRRGGGKRGKRRKRRERGKRGRSGRVGNPTQAVRRVLSPAAPARRRPGRIKVQSRTRTTSFSPLFPPSSLLYLSWHPASSLPPAPLLSPGLSPPRPA